jgi:hypothetical protein
MKFASARKLNRKSGVRCCERGAPVRCPLAAVNGSASLGRGRCQAGLVFVGWYWRETELGSAEWR